MAAARRSQDEAEQLVKGYQLDAVEAQVKALQNQVQTGFTRVNNSLETLLIKSETQVTPQQLAEHIAATRTTLENHISDEIEKVHLEYQPVKKNNTKFMGLILTEGVIIVFQLLYMFYIVNKGS